MNKSSIFRILTYLVVIVILAYSCSSKDDNNEVEAQQDFVTIGTQDWSSSNASVITYRDGTPIPEVTDLADFENLTTGAWCYFDNDPSKERLYNWYAVAGIHDADPNTPNKEFAPDGWHVPSHLEWINLENYLIANDYNFDGTTRENKIAKALASNSGWDNSTTVGTPGNNQITNNSSGFNAFPVGALYNSKFNHEGEWANFWTSTEDEGFPCECTAWYRGIGYQTNKLDRGANAGKQYGMSVRFIRD